MPPHLRWSLAAGVLIAAVGLILAIPALAREPRNQIAVHSVPREVAPGPAASPAATAAPLAWTLPAGWSPAGAKPMRLAVFTVENAGECGLFLFPGGGDRLANVNRWRGQAGLAPLDGPALAGELATGTCAFGPFAWLAVKGPDKAFLAAMLSTPGGQCFAKLEAPAERLDGLRDGFLAFCQSLRPAGGP